MDEDLVREQDEDNKSLTTVKNETRGNYEGYSDLNWSTDN